AGMETVQNPLFSGNVWSEADAVREKQKSSRIGRGIFKDKRAIAFQHYSNPALSRSWIYHAYTMYLFTCDNLVGIVVLGYMFAVPSALCGQKLGFGANMGLLEILRKTPAVLIWSWTHLLMFQLQNQHTPAAIQEDRINKAWRPLPTGRLTTAEASWLMYAMYPIVILLSVYSGGLGPCLLGTFTCIWYNEWQGAESPFLRTFLNAVGFSCFLAGPLEVLVVGSRDSLLNHPRATQWLALLAVANFTTIHTQDFRDLDGDRLRSRRTVPLVVGDNLARWIVVAAVILCSGLAPAFWHLGVMGSLLPASTGSVMVCNLLWNKTREGDGLSWKLWPFWIISFFFLPLMSSTSS
ncbi:hypothetical protein MMC07_005240, partial [Pseudocyphellaria aurata]|nr:hypothetical protein [Pseudocyphellaria aurata]